MTMDTPELKRQLMLLIGDSIDEGMLPSTSESFVEMDHRVIHVVADGQDRYFRVTLTEVAESTYFDAYDPAAEGE
jgi:hypothetical protein